MPQSIRREGCLSRGYQEPSTVSLDVADRRGACGSDFAVPCGRGIGGIADVALAGPFAVPGHGCRLGDWSIDWRHLFSRSVESGEHIRWQGAWILAGHIRLMVRDDHRRIIGFLAGALSRPLARWLSSEEELARMDALANRHGILILILARPVPVFAEASILVMGTMQIGW